jgi:protein-S-isoprenylcysteine O-methyltransferase Ste14
MRSDDSTGPYGLVRHPLYVAAFLIWFSLALAFSNLAALVIALVYVIPSYLIYMRAEEEMLLRHLGDAYATYRACVGMLFPRIRG